MRDWQTRVSASALKPISIEAPVRAASSRCPETKSACRWVSSTQRMVRPWVLASFPPHPTAYRPRTSLINASVLPSVSLKNAIHSSWSGSLAMKWGLSPNATPRSEMVRWAWWMSSTW